jgi:hypothetical protein
LFYIFVNCSRQNGESEEVEKNESYAVYDIETGDIFDKKFYSGKSKNLVIFSKADNKFLEELSLGQKTRGVTISCITDKKGINAVLSDDEGKRISNMNSIKKMIGVPLDKSIPLIHLDINPLNGIRIYDEDLNLDEPSRAVMVVTTKKWQLGIVQDVPAKIRCRKSTDLNEQKENEKVLIKENANCYIYDGKLSNFNFLKNVEKKVFNKKPVIFIIFKLLSRLINY